MCFVHPEVSGSTRSSVEAVREQASSRFARDRDVAGLLSGALNAVSGLDAAICWIAVIRSQRLPAMGIRRRLRARQFHRLHALCNTEHADHALEVLGERVEADFGGHVLERLHQEVR